MLEMIFIAPSGVQENRNDHFPNVADMYQLEDDIEYIWDRGGDSILEFMNEQIQAGILYDPDMFGNHNGYSIVARDNGESVILVADSGAQLQLFKR